MRKFVSSLSKLSAAALGLFVMGSGSDFAIAQDKAALDCSSVGSGMSLRDEAKCACDAALRSNSIEALEEFLFRYGEVDTRCTALASTALKTNFGGGKTYVGSENGNGSASDNSGVLVAGGYGN